LRQLIEYDTFKDDRGRTRREDLEAFGEDDLLPEPIELSMEQMRYLELFFKIGKFRKPQGGMGGQLFPLGAEEIKGYETLHRIELTDLEVRLVLDLDTQYRSSMGQEQEKQAQIQADKAKSGGKGNYDL
jgi:hypothetical protein